MISLISMGYRRDGQQGCLSLVTGYVHIFLSVSMKHRYLHVLCGVSIFVTTACVVNASLKATEDVVVNGDRGWVTCELWRSPVRRRRVKKQVLAAVRTIHSLELEIVNKCCPRPHKITLM